MEICPLPSVSYVLRYSRQNCCRSASYGSYFARTVMLGLFFSHLGSAHERRSCRSESGSKRGHQLSLGASVKAVETYLELPEIVLSVRVVETRPVVR